MRANVYEPVTNMGAIAKILADKNGRLKRPSQTNGLEYVPPTASQRQTRQTFA